MDTACCCPIYAMNLSVLDQCAFWFAYVSCLLSIDLLKYVTKSNTCWPFEDFVLLRLTLLAVLMYWILYSLMHLLFLV
jgi:hypothetical protein